ncbi:hypothetical protein D3C78_1081810 [compost metagenome]
MLQLQVGEIQQQALPSRLEVGIRQALHGQHIGSTGQLHEVQPHPRLHPAAIADQYRALQHQQVLVIQSEYLRHTVQVARMNAVGRQRIERIGDLAQRLAVAV